MGSRHQPWHQRRVCRERRASELPACCLAEATAALVKGPAMASAPPVLDPRDESLEAIHLGRVRTASTFRRGRSHAAPSVYSSAPSCRPPRDTRTPRRLRGRLYSPRGAPTAQRQAFGHVSQATAARVSRPVRWRLIARGLTAANYRMGSVRSQSTDRSDLSAFVAPLHVPPGPVQPFYLRRL